LLVSPAIAGFKPSICELGRVIHGARPAIRFLVSDHRVHGRAPGAGVQVIGAGVQVIGADVQVIGADVQVIGVGVQVIGEGVQVIEK
jgi:hypothetical protein